MMELNVKRTGLEARFFDEMSEVITKLGHNIYDMRYIASQSLIRVFIYSGDDLTADLEDCIKVDRGLSDFFESSDWIPEDTTLEVSSPGVYRDIRDLSQLQLHKGAQIKFSILGSLNDEQYRSCGAKYHKAKSFIGTLNSIKDKVVVVDLDGDSRVSFEASQLKKVSCHPDFNELKKKAINKEK